MKLKTMLPIVALLTASGAPIVVAKDADPSCKIHQSREISFRDLKSHDLVDVDIGNGACSKAKLTLTIKSDSGRTLYSFVSLLQRHRVDASGAQRFVDGLLKDGLSTTGDLPPFEAPDAYYESNDETIQVPRARYEELKAKPRPLFCHPTYYEGWQCVAFDKARNKALLVTTGNN